MNLTASVIVRNELHRYLEPCLGHLLEFCDQIVVLDDGSSDGWEKVISDPKIVRHYHHVDGRQGEPAFHRHAAARNRLLDLTREAEPDWVLAIDADEFISDGAALRATCEDASKNPQTGVVSVEISEVWQACEEVLCTREDGGWRSHPIGCVWRPSVFPPSGFLSDKGHATGRVPDIIHARPAVHSGAYLLHFGWANLSERSERFARYRDGDGGRFHAAAHIESILWPASRVRLAPMGWSSALEPYRPELLSRANRS